PVTYINSAASLKAFCGRHGGIVCTSSNARAVLEWSFKRTKRVFFFPDQHLGRNTALKMGITNAQMPVFDPHDSDLGGNREEAIRDSRVILWKGHCSVHQMFRAEHVQLFRQRFLGIKILVHPECPQEVNDQADVSGSTSKIIKTVEASPPGTKWAIGTELHLVNRLKHEHPEQEIHFLSPVVCMCATMYRIDLAHLCWSLENLAAGTPVNVIQVDPETARFALVALERMLAVRENCVAQDPDAISRRPHWLDRPQLQVSSSQRRLFASGIVPTRTTHSCFMRWPTGKSTPEGMSFGTSWSILRRSIAGHLPAS